MLANSDIRRLYAQSQKLNSDNFSGGSSVMWDESAAIFTKTRTLALLAFLITVAIICRVVYLNTFNNSFLAKQLDSRILRTVKIPSMRGTITDRNNNPLAVSTPVASIWVDPTQLDDLNKEQIDKAANILGITVEGLNSKLNQKNKTFVYIKRAVTPQQAQQVMALGIGGVYSLQEYKRFYPYSDVAAHVVGFNNIDDSGAEGIEFADNHDLLGHDGKEKLMRDRRGHVIEKLGQISAAENGKSIALSIDNKIQFIAYDALKKQVATSNAVGGAALVLDAKTGEVLAMVNMPSYNPNDRAAITADAVRNRAAIDIYEPGSIIKPLIVSKALNNGIVKTSTIFDTHQYYVGNKLIKDDHSYPAMDVSEIIQHSSDIGASKIALKLNKQDMWQYYYDIGFGQKVGTHFPGEASGIFRNWKKWYPIDQAEMGFGYGISVSLMQMARAYSLFTNDGCLLPITFYKENQLPECKQVITPSTASLMRNILAQSTTDGTGKTAQTDDYTTAGKTGTAQKYSGNGYSNKQHYGSFVGFAPATNPRIIIAVTIDEPRKGSYYGSAVAAPVFAAIAEPALRSLDVKPDKIKAN